jgi:putative flippase GtrA
LLKLTRLIAFLTQHPLVRYVAAGALSNLVSYMFFVACYTLAFRHHVVPAYLVASLLAMPLSFALNRMWVFESGADLWPELRRFICVYAAAIAAGLSILLLLVRVVPAPVILVQAISTVALVICFFLAHSLWTFARRVPRAGSPRD